MKLRTLLFWSHLTAGSLAGLVILLMASTGVLLAYEKQITRWAERGYRTAPEAQGQRLSIEAVLRKAGAGEAAAPATVAWHADPGAAVEVVFGRDRALFVDPWSGRILGPGSGVRGFFHRTEELHRWLGVSLARRSSGRAVTAAVNLLFFFLVSSGIYLWWPRTWSKASLRAATRFNGKLRGRAREFNWHTVIGFWCCLPLLVVVGCSVVMSYPWATNVVYRLTGNPPPAAQAGPPGGAAQPRPFASLGLEGLDALAARAERKVAGWQTITLRLPGERDRAATFLIDAGNGGRPDQRGQLTLDRKTGDETRWEPFSSYNSGRRLRTWIRFTHTGEAWGLAGQTAAALASLGACFLVWTGISMAFRRWTVWAARRKTGLPGQIGEHRFGSAAPAEHGAVDR